MKRKRHLSLIETPDAATELGTEAARVLAAPSRPPSGYRVELHKGPAAERPLRCPRALLPFLALRCASVIQRGRDLHLFRSEYPDGGGRLTSQIYRVAVNKHYGKHNLGLPERLSGLVLSPIWLEQERAD